MMNISNFLILFWCLVPSVSCLLLEGARTTLSSRRSAATGTSSMMSSYDPPPRLLAAGHCNQPTIILYSVPNENTKQHPSRAQFLSKATMLSYGTLCGSSLLAPLPSLAAGSPSSVEDNANGQQQQQQQQQDNNRTFTKIQQNKNDPKQSFAYTLTLPAPFTTTRKPLPTHLDEVNLVTTVVSPDEDAATAAGINPSTTTTPAPLKGYSFGITVDPIRIQSLRDFGTPNEVAAKIVMAELRRDGVLDVTMGRDPTEDPLTGAYDVEYVSDGTRGKKHFVTRTIVRGQKLYVLTVQCREIDWKSVEGEVWDSVKTFCVLDMN
jgi:PsbP.